MTTPASGRLKWWGWRIALGIYGLLVLAATVRTWLKLDGQTAAKILGIGIIFGFVIFRASAYASAVFFGGRPNLSRRTRS